MWHNPAGPESVFVPWLGRHGATIGSFRWKRAAYPLGVAKRLEFALSARPASALWDACRALDPGTRSVSPIDGTRGTCARSKSGDPDHPDGTGMPALEIHQAEPSFRNAGVSSEPDRPAHHAHAAFSLRFEGRPMFEGRHASLRESFPPFERPWDRVPGRREASRLRREARLPSREFPSLRTPVGSCTGTKGGFPIAKGGKMFETHRAAFGSTLTGP
jgi:hypothetical protein